MMMFGARKAATWSFSGVNLLHSLWMGRCRQAATGSTMEPDSSVCFVCACVLAIHRCVLVSLTRQLFKQGAGECHELGT
jgi:hypothetical protein